jgi:ferritin-like metal-binding protein YciE
MTKRQMTRVSALKDEAYAAGDNETAALCAEALDGDQAAISKLTVMLLSRTSEPSKLVGRAWGKRQSIPTHPRAHDED